MLEAVTSCSTFPNLKQLAALAPYAAEGSRPVLLLAAQAALAASTPSAPNDALLKERAADLRTWVALNPRDSL